MSFISWQSLKVGQFTARWLMRVFPFASKSVVVDADDEQLKNPQPSIWVCNHISMLDLFFVLALDNKMRGQNRRPIKILYWKGLEANPITCLLCKMCGFIPVSTELSFFVCFWFTCYINFYLRSSLPLQVDMVCV